MRFDGRLLASAGLVLAFGAAAAPASGAHAQSLNDLQTMSIADLANVDVSSVSKTSESLSDAPAAIFVISHDDIARSGATSIPEMLRLAPNLQVAQLSGGKYVITARGFSGNSSAQNFSDKLLVLIDGRSVYSPLFSGVYWDLQDVLPEDIDRIEVISGPGATLWGANAVNGVINIVTRKSSETQGALLTVGGGNQEQSASFRYGGRVGQALTWRIYAKGFIDDDTVTASGAKAHDNWSKPQGGFRMDWAPPGGDVVTLQGDAYEGTDAQDGAPDEDITGRNILARWTHPGAGGSSLQVQAYYDGMGRLTEQNGGDFRVDTYDIDVQDSFNLGRRNQVVLGGGFRSANYLIHGAGALDFSPNSGALNLANVFVQDSLSVTGTVKLILGLKVEDDPYSGVSVLPNARLSWKPAPSTLLWVAGSRAIRSPTPFDRDVVESVGGSPFLIGGPDFQPEKLDAFEAGARVQPSSRLSFSVSGFYNDYDDLRSVGPKPGGFLPLRWGNAVEGETYGVEAWGEFKAASWWRLSAGFNLLYEHLRVTPGQVDLLGVSQEGDDPEHQAQVRSSMNLGDKVTLDADLRYVGALPDPHVPAYVELGGRLAWNVTDHVQLSLAGLNLLHDHHQERPAAVANAVPRSVFAELRLHF